MRRNNILLFILTLICTLICSNSHAYTTQGYDRGDIIAGKVKRTTVATLPTNSVGRVRVVTDGASASDCTTGGGSTKVLCWNNGTTWTAVGSGGGSTDLTTSNSWTIGDGASGDIVLTFNGDGGTDGTMTEDVSEDTFTFNFPLQPLSSSTISLTLAGSFAFDNDYHGVSRGAMFYRDGTSNAEIVGILGGKCGIGQRPDYTATGWGCANDATGSGLGTSFASTDDDLISSSGLIDLGASGGINNEIISFDFESVANTVDVTSSTGVTAFDFSDFNFTVLSLSTVPSATPTRDITDSDGIDGDVSVRESVNYTDTGSGTEDADYTLSQQINGVMTAFLTADADGDVSIPRFTDATTTAQGDVELATVAEVEGGSDTVRAITPDALAGSNLGEKVVQATIVGYTTDTAIGDGQYYFVVPSSMTGMDLVEVHAEVITAGTTGTTDIQIHNVNDAVDILSTKLTIDSAETGSDTAATAAVINTSNDDVNSFEVLRIDVDAVSTTAAKGLIVTMIFRLP